VQAKIALIEDADHRGAVEDYQEGIPRLAAFLDSNESFCMFRRFGTTTARVLLHRQIELDILVDQLHKLDQEDAAAGDKLYRLSSVEHKEGWDTAQRKLMETFDTKIRDYCECECTCILFSNQLVDGAEKRQMNFF
jgi:hypothetical protein